MSFRICALSLFFLLQIISANRISIFRMWGRIRAAEGATVKTGHTAVAADSQPFPKIEQLCDDLSYLIFDYFDFKSNLNMRAVSKTEQAKLFEFLKRKVELGYWRHHIKDDFDLVRDNQLGIMYLYKCLIPHFKYSWTDTTISKTSRTNHLNEIVKVSLLDAVKILTNFRGTSDLPKARFWNKMLRCNFISLEEIQFEYIMATLMVCLDYNLIFIMKAIFLKIKEKWALDENQAHELLFALAICNYNLQRSDLKQSIRNFMDIFGHRLTVFDRIRLKIRFFYYYDPRGILNEIMTGIYVRDYKYF